MPDEMLWQRTFQPGEFVARVWEDGLQEGWLEPPDWYEPDGDTVCWQYNFFIDPVQEPFIQEGTPDRPIVYWLGVEARPEDMEAQFGWKTSIRHWNDDAVWRTIIGPDGPEPLWNELRYPPEHPFFPESVDLAFVITGEDLEPEFDFGDAPENSLAYPASGVVGKFPTCTNTGPATHIQHSNFGTWFGPLVDFESDGNAGSCPLFNPNNYDQDECFQDGDAGLIAPPSYTIQGPVGQEQVVPCTGQTGALGQICQTATWGANVDILIHNWMPNHPPYVIGYVNVLMDWNQDGQWSGTSPCPTAAVPEHVLVDFVIPPQYDGTLSALGPLPFLIGPNPGHVWTRFSITERPVGPNWDGSGTFEDGETEDYLLLVDDRPDPESDLGDAPDSTNSHGNSPMTAYPVPGVMANYPTVYQAGSPPYGPIHWQPRAVAFLGQNVTLENEADIGPDQDPANNIDPPNDAPDQDMADDGVNIPLTLPHCQQTTFNYTVTVTAPVAQPLFVNVWFDWDRDGDWSDVLQCGPNTPAPEWAVQNQVIAVAAPGPHTFATPPFLPWHAAVGADAEPIWMRITLSEQQWPPGVGAIPAGGCGPAAGYAYGETEDYFFVPEIPIEPEDYVIEFSLDIGSDTELSDPFFNGNEAFDPGDVYAWHSAPVIPPGRDGFKDDMMIFGQDPYPDPPDMAIPPVTRVPVGLVTSPPEWPEEWYRMYFDLDGHDQIDMPLTDMVPPDMPLPHPIPMFHSLCIHPPEFVMISFDDDLPPGWMMPPMGDVPVTAPSLAGMIYGSTAGQDEVLGLFLPNIVTPGPVIGPYGMADEVTVHQSLAPNPDAGEEEDDDVDSLDIVPPDDACPFWYFSADHEATNGLDPGGIYMISPHTPMPTLIQVIDELHLGIREDTDIDAFEFAWIESPDGAGLVLALLFSVDDDDPLTPIDESGGLMSGMIYASYLTGTSFEYLDHPLHDDIDALTLWEKDLLPPILVTAVSRRLHGGMAGGAFYDIQIEPTTVPGQAEVEPRMNGTMPQEVFTFVSPMEAIDGSVDCGQEVVVVNGSCIAATIAGNQLVVDMTFTNNACVKTTLSGLRGAGGGQPMPGPINVEVVAHQGNVNGDSAVNVIDLQDVKNHVFQTVGLSNFKYDVNVDGRINVIDLQETKNNVFQPASCP